MSTYWVLWSCTQHVYEMRHPHIDSVIHKSNYIANSLELRLFCIKSMIVAIDDNTTGVSPLTLLTVIFAYISREVAMKGKVT